MTDIVTKFLLAAIAIGTWANSTALRRVEPAQGSSDIVRNLSSIDKHLENIYAVIGSIERDMIALVDGRCKNQRLCP